MTDPRIEQLREAARWCPRHHIPDCSPLLNGCSLPNGQIAALSSLETELEAYRRKTFELSDKVAAVEALVEKWRDRAGPLYKVGSGGVAREVDEMADQLEAALSGSTPEDTDG